MSPLDWFKKESPLQGLTGLWGGIASNLTSGGGGEFTGANWSPAPAGSQSSHPAGGTLIAFTAPATLTIAGGTMEDANFMLVGKGGSGGPHNYGGGGGGGGLVYVQGVDIPKGDYPITVSSNCTFNGYTALQGGPTGATGGWDPDGSKARGRPGGCGGGTGRTGAYINNPNAGGIAQQPGQSQPGSPGNPGYTQYGHPGFGPSHPRNMNVVNAGGGTNGGGGPTGLNQSRGGGPGTPINITTPGGVIYGAGGPVPSRFNSQPGTADPNTQYRGGGNGREGTVILYYPA